MLKKFIFGGNSKNFMILVASNKEELKIRYCKSKCRKLRCLGKNI